MMVKNTVELSFMKPIAHYETRYMISAEGAVLNLANDTFLKLQSTPNGYVVVALANGNGTSKQMLVHRLVALHYLPNPYEYPQVNHIDGNKTNNEVQNLEWCSAEQNINHALKTNLRPGYLPFKTKLELLERALAGESIKDLAIEVDRSQETLARMLREAANKTNQRNKWNLEMKRRRRDVAIRNLATINN